MQTIFPDEIETLPLYGKVKTKQFAGLVNGTSEGNNKLFYWFCESDKGSHDPTTPLLIWLNGGPGASSLTGLFAEKLGPIKILANGTLQDNPDRITKKYHLMAIDNPVGSGFSASSTDAYVRSEYEMRSQFTEALRGFFERHPEYAANPLWVTGESYAGHYVPNIAWEIAVNATDLNLQGVVIGNGLYNMATQYQSIGKMAYGAGVIDDAVLAEMEGRQLQCEWAIRSSPATAGDFCENVTVRWLFTAEQAGDLFYYDVGLPDANFLDEITAAMGKYLNRPDVKTALHLEASSKWVQADEVGPVGNALLPDWPIRADTVIEHLLGLNLKVRLYNGVRDLSSCNHIGNAAVVSALKWEGAHTFAKTTNKPWPSRTSVEGHIKSVSTHHGGSLAYATLLRTGHLVPLVVPEAFSTLLDILLGDVE